MLYQIAKERLKVVETLTPRAKQEVFFKLLFGQSRGFLCLAFLNPNDKKDMRERWFVYPEQLPQALDTIDELARTLNAYFCPQLFNEKKRNKEFVSITTCAWSDLDTCDPDNLLVQPSIVVESSSERYHGYWLFDPSKEVLPSDAEDLSRRIAYYHKDQGADKSGWDLTQLLRVPETFNFKYPGPENLGYPVVTINEIKKLYYRVSDFSDYPILPDYDYIDAAIPTKFPDKTGSQLLNAVQADISPLIIRLFTDTPPEKLWSQKLWQLMSLLFETGFSREEVFVIARDSACNKYARDSRTDAQLWKDVCRAESAVQLKKDLPVDKIENVVSLMTREEANLVSKLPQSFIEKYIDWASTLSDAAYQYHQAGAFILLSSILCGSVKLPTSFGNIIPNIWFMILADTTLTRKTTSMDIPMDLLEEIDRDAIMATDGSIEGMFTNLALRPKKPSIFLRDEFSGLIESMTKKDYMAGMPEMLTKLYDGKIQKRILRKETIEVRDPRLVIFGGGIKNKVTSAVTYEHIASGFLPRFVFITAESDVSRIKPMGPPTNKSMGKRLEILSELQGMYDFYNGVQSLSFMDSKNTIEVRKDFDAELTDEAWTRYNLLEYTLVELGTQSILPEIYTPVGDRLAKSILKAAVLIAASRQRTETVVVELQDILRAIKYGEQWRAYAEEIIENVGKSQSERKIDLMMDIIRKRGAEGASRSRIMRALKLSAREAGQMFDTLVQRGLVEKTSNGSQIVYMISE